MICNPKVSSTGRSRRREEADFWPPFRRASDSYSENGGPKARPHPNPLPQERGTRRTSFCIFIISDAGVAHGDFRRRLRFFRHGLMRKFLLRMIPPGLSLLLVSLFFGCSHSAA